MSIDKRIRLAQLACLTFLATALVACSDSGPTNPEPAGLKLLKKPTNVIVATRNTPIYKALTVRETIGPSGGWFRIPAAGLSVHVPRGAVGMNTAFSVTAIPGDLIAYEFGPHGTRFSIPLDVFQTIGGRHGVRIQKGEKAPNFEAAYFPDLRTLDPSTGEIFVNELLPTTVDLRLGVIRFSVEHFSGYILASGNRPRGGS